MPALLATRRGLLRCEKTHGTESPSRTSVYSESHLSYIGRVLASRRLCSLHRSSDTHRARPQSGRPLRPSENQHLTYLDYRNSPANPIDSGSASEHHYESTGGNADNAAKSFHRAEQRALSLLSLFMRQRPAAATAPTARDTNCLRGVSADAPRTRSRSPASRSKPVCKATSGPSPAVRARRRVPADRGRGRAARSSTGRPARRRPSRPGC